MNRRLSVIARMLLAAFAFAVVTAGTASAHDWNNGDRGDTGEFRWLASAGMHLGGFLCDGPTPCPDAALAEDGNLIEIVGEGTLRIRRGRPKKVHGGGSYRQTDMYGNITGLGVGTWTAKKLKSFESFGPSMILLLSFEQGEALIEIRMVSESGKMRAKATLLLGCLLPEPFTPAPAEVIEGIRLSVKGGQNFDMAPPDLFFGSPPFPPMTATSNRATLFIRLDDD